MSRLVLRACFCEQPLDLNEFSPEAPYLPALWIGVRRGWQIAMSKRVPLAHGQEGGML